MKSKDERTGVNQPCDALQAERETRHQKIKAFDFRSIFQATSFVIPPSALRVHHSAFKLRPSSLIPRLSSIVPLLLLLCLTVPLCELRAEASEKPRSRAERALRKGDYELAEKLYREILKEDAGDTEARLGLSYTLYKRRNLRDSFEQARFVLAREPWSSRAHALVGLALLATGEFRQSAEQFRIALNINNHEALAVAGMAMIDYYENRLPSSVNGFRRAVALDSREPDYLFSLAQATARTERYKEAADAYERFLRVAPHTDDDRRARIRGLIDFMRFLGKQKRLYMPVGEDNTVVSFEDVNNRPIVRVRVNGAKEPLRFVLDTGSGMCVISEETARRLDINPVARGGQARAVGGMGRFEIVYGFLSSLEIGKTQINNVPVYIRRFYNDGTGVDGYIGLAVINKFIARVDYGSQTFALLSREAAGKPLNQLSRRNIEIPIRTTTSGFLSGEVQLEGIERPLNFIVDTGASVSVVAQAVATSEEMDRYMQDLKMKIYGAAGVAENVKVLLLPRLTLGPLMRERISAAVLDLDPINETTGFVQSGILGGNFLRHFRVTFDFKKAVVQLEPLKPLDADKIVPEGEARLAKP
ncbi:MAG TPA: aspartyl protease family protein [Pyrinomonadaceae bacterium]